MAYTNIPSTDNLAGDVTSDGSGTTTVVTVGTSLAADVHTAEVLANAATSANTASAIVKRDANRDFFARNIKGTGAITMGYTLQTPVTTDSYTIADNISSVLIKPAGTIAAYTLTMPANPIDGQILCLSTSQIITSLTLNANSGQTLVGTLTTLALGANKIYQYTTTGNLWFPIS